jgi:dynein heavy chain 2
LKAHFSTLYRNLQLDDAGTWNEFMRTTQCESSFPSAVDTKLTPFQKLIVIQALRPDRLYAAINQFALNALGLIGFIWNIWT